MVSIVLVALNLRPSMAAVGPLLAAIRLEVPLGFGMASLLTMLPIMAMGLAMFFGIGIARYLGTHRSILLSLVLIGLATLARLVLDSAVELIFSAVLAGLGIALIQALMPALIKSRFKANVSLCMGLYVTAIMGGAALAASFSPLVMSSSGSWRAGLAVWSLLALLAVCVWFAQRRVLQVDTSNAAGPRQAFFPYTSGLDAGSFLRPRYCVLYLRTGLACALLPGERLERAGCRSVAGLSDPDGGRIGSAGSGAG